MNADFFDKTPEKNSLNPRPDFKSVVCMQNMSGNLLPAPSSARDYPRKPPPPTGGFAQDGGLSGGADNLCLHTECKVIRPSVCFTL